MANYTPEVAGKDSGPASEFKKKVLNSDHQIEKFAQSAGERVGEMASNLANSTADTMRSSREYVAENPVKGVAIAAAAGLVAGSLLTLAIRSRKN